jgi:hypothetical protein
VKTGALVSLSDGCLGVVGPDQRATALVALINENGNVTLRLAREGESPFAAQDALEFSDMAKIAEGVKPNG